MAREEDPTAPTAGDRETEVANGGNSVVYESEGSRENEVGRWRICGQGEPSLVDSCRNYRGVSRARLRIRGIGFICLGFA